ncbi:T9SS type A sorting domain-containing protein [Cryomorphaceae bacterium 1068]|nr:T9SS type A sorting domain-containing protein [Cryomorphaceae bacterium 1068]
MKKLYFLLGLAFLGSQATMAQTIWTGETMTFVKAGGADFTLEENQDRITNDVWITRGNNQGIYNIAVESSYEDFVSPVGTEWAIGTTSDIESLTFTDWESTSGSNPPSLVNQDMVVHLIDDDIYIDIKFTNWGSGMQGGQGAFSYERSTNQSLSVDDASANQEIVLFPNPAVDYIQVSGLEDVQQYSVFNLLGQEVKNGLITEMGQIQIGELQRGLYFLRIGNGPASRFVKN